MITLDMMFRRETFLRDLIRRNECEEGEIKKDPISSQLLLICRN